ncbi:MAG TPA: hypothetical protein VGQ19_20880 [Burkholderiales bacterium]|jgi:hypothetical protein|nr:hypothetical protein [Burkholderiales bacterium]
MNKVVGIFCAAALLLGPVLAQAEEVDCGSSPFAYLAGQHRLECEHYTKQIHEGEGSGTMTMDVMTIASDDPRMFLTLASIQVNATRMYFEYRNLSQNFHEVFPGIEAREWKGIGNKDGYDSAEFKTEISGMPSRCIAIQRYTNHAWTGYKRHMVGMGCAPDDLGLVYAALQQVHAPGD